MHDVIIVGGGVAGCAMAIALKQVDEALDICVIERNPEKSTGQPIGETLPPQVSQLLQQLGLWERFKASEFLPSFGSSSAWGSAHLYQNEFLFSPYGSGWHLDRPLFNRMIREEAYKRGVAFIFETSIIDCESSGGGWQLDCFSVSKGKTRLSSKFVIDASGRKADFAIRVGATKAKEDQLVGLYRFFEQEFKSVLGRGACVETDSHGWWYSACLPGDLTVVAFMTDSDIALQQNLKDEVGFYSRLEKSRFTKTRIDTRLGRTSGRLIAASTQKLNQVTGDRWLAVGDAASTYDPISSSGIFKALAMSRYAAFATMDCLHGLPRGLEKYSRIVEQDFQSYLDKRAAYYGLEQRFADQPFWQRRARLIEALP